MRYILATSTSFNDIQTAVNSLLVDGWRCIGGIAIIQDTYCNDLNFYQALIKD